MSFVRNATSLTVNRFAGAGLAILISALSARILTPGDMGAVVATTALVALLTRLVSLGIGQSAQYYGARELSEDLHYGQALFVVSLFISLVTLGLLLFFAPALGSTLLPRDPGAQKLFEIFCFGIPLTFVHFVASLYVLGRRELTSYMWVSLVPVIASVIVLAWGAWSQYGLQAVIWAWMAQFGIALLCGVLIFGKHKSKPSSPLLPTLIDMFRYGRHSYLVSTAAFAAGRLSLIVGAWFTVGSQVGLFAVGRTFAEALMLVYGAIGPLIFSYVGSTTDSDAAHSFVGRVSRLSLLLFSSTSVAVGFLAPIAIPLVFGQQYDMSYLIVWLLLPGLVLSAQQRIVENYLFGRAKQAPLIYVHLVSMVVLVASSAFLGPIYGAVGLALASTISFAATYAFTLLVAFRSDGLRMGELLAIRPSDLHSMHRYVALLGTRLRKGFG